MQKIGIFIDKSTRRVGRIDSDEIETYIYDINTDRNSTLNKAVFLWKILGLKMSSDNDVMTTNFIDILGNL